EYLVAGRACAVEVATVEGCEALDHEGTAEQGRRPGPSTHRDRLVAVGLGLGVTSETSRDHRERCQDGTDALRVLDLAEEIEGFQAGIKRRVEVTEQEGQAAGRA